jgi:uncharacterized integral membrane protein
MYFFVDLFLEFLALIIGIVGALCVFAGAIMALIFALLTYIDISSITSFTLPSAFHWSYGVGIILVGVLFMAFSSVMRKRISNPRR